MGRDRGKIRVKSVKSAMACFGDECFFVYKVQNVLRYECYSDLLLGVGFGDDGLQYTNFLKFAVTFRYVVEKTKTGWNYKRFAE